MERKLIKGSSVLLARQSRGLSQKDLAASLGIGQGTLSKIEISENYEAPEELVKKLEESLYYREKTFREKIDVYPPLAGFHFRKRMALKSKQQETILALANFQRLYIKKFLPHVNIEKRVPFIEADEFGNDPATVARAVRKTWNVPKGPIENLTQLIEDSGVIVVPTEFGTSLVDAFSVVDGLNPDLIFMSRTIPGDRWRFTIAHEIGHIIMHKRISHSMEDEANKFAAELLMPELEIKHSLHNLTLHKLAQLKEYWKVSMAAIIKRAIDLCTISASEQKYLYVQMNKHGFKAKEPIELPIEEPSTLRDIMSTCINTYGWSINDLSEMLGLYEDDLVTRYPDNYRWHVIQKNPNLTPRSLAVSRPRMFMA